MRKPKGKTKRDIKFMKNNNDLTQFEYHLYSLCLISGLSVGPIAIFSPLDISTAYILFGSLPAIIATIIGKGLQKTGGYTRAGPYYRKETNGDLYFFAGIYVGGLSLLFFMFLEWVYTKLF